MVSLATVDDRPSADGERATDVVAPSIRLSISRIEWNIGRFKNSTTEPPQGRHRCYWKSTYRARLDDEVIRDIVAGMAKRPSEMTYASVWKFGGAVQRVAADATAFGDRSMPYMLSIDGIWSRPSDDAANIAWVRNFWRDMQRHSTGRLYLNFPGHGEDDNLVRDAFGAQAYARLQEIKRKYDPTNLFRMNQNIEISVSWPPSVR